MGDSIQGKENQQKLAEYLTKAGYNVNDLVLYFRNSDQGSGFRNREGRADLNLNADELTKALAGLAESITGNKINTNTAEGKKFKDAVKSMVGEDGIDLEDLEKAIRSADKNNDGRVTFQEMGVTPQALAAIDAMVSQDQTR